MKNILITAHPRSGTRYIANLLNAIGYSCTYEKKNPNGFTASWKHIISGEFEKPCPETNIVFDFDKVIHQVRHPLNVIASSTSLWIMSIKYMAKFIDLPDPIVNKNNTVLNCMISWLKWNEIIESKASWRYRIENIQYVQKELCEQLEIPNQAIPEFRHANTREHMELTWDDLYKININITDDIKNKAFQYGYSK